MGKDETITPDEKRKQRKLTYNEMREQKDPCAKESTMTLKCLEDNGYDKDKCQRYFLNYRSCRKFWSRVELDRKKKGVHPHMPSPEERETVKKEYQRIITERPK